MRGQSDEGQGAVNDLGRVYRGNALFTLYIIVTYRLGAILAYLWRNTDSKPPSLESPEFRLTVKISGSTLNSRW